MRHASSRPTRPLIGAVSLAALVAASAISESAHAALDADGTAVSGFGHLVVSEVMTGGTSASDEFVELYNPGPAALELDGVELVYATASGATVTRKAVWGPGTEIGPGSHLLVANEGGLFAAVADATYANGLAASGGSMALRVIGATTAIDAVGWGNAASAWLEGAPAPAAPAGESLERLPGSELGSGQDTDNNLVDFVIRAMPDPQNSASPPVPPESQTPAPSPIASPSESPSSSIGPAPSVSLEPTSTPTGTTAPSLTPDPATPTPPATPSPTATQAPTLTPTPSPAPLTVAEARAQPDGRTVLVRGTALAGSEFTEGGGYLADASGGIAILLDDGTFPRGVELEVSGTVDDRFAQRTVRAEAAGVTVVGPGADLEAVPVDSGAVGENLEGQLVTVSGVIAGAPTELAAGLAYEINDGSGPLRVLVGPNTGIDTTAWQGGSSLTVTGVIGQRDSSGTGTDGYRVQPRDGGDVLALLPPATPEPTTSPSPPPSATPSPTTTAGKLMTIAEVRAAGVGTRNRIRGVVTLPTGLVEAASAVVADSSGAILVRTGTDAGRLRRGDLVELSGSRSTLSGMESLRISERATVLGSQADPAAVRRTTGGIREADEAVLVVVRGLVAEGPRRTSGGGLTLTLNDGSGALRVFVAAGTGITAGSLPTGSWVELRGIVGQQTTGAAPNAGYRLWPRDRADAKVIARSTSGGRGSGSGPSQVRPGEPRTTTALGSQAIPPTLTRPNLGGAAALPLSVRDLSRGKGSQSPTLPPIQVPLAAGLGGLAGLLALAWRHGTWTRLRLEVERRAALVRTSANHEVEDESYTLAP